MTQKKLGEFEIEAAETAANAIGRIGDWSSTAEGMHYWSNCVTSLRAMSGNGTSDGRPLPPGIPQGYRAAKSDEHWRLDAVYYDSIRREWGDRIIGMGSQFSQSLSYAVPVDVIPTDAHCEQGRPVVMVQERGDCWLPAKLLAVLAERFDKYLVLLGDKYSLRSTCRYPYAGELEHIRNSTCS